MTREALTLAFLDDLDSKMGATRAALAADSGDEMWSTYVPALSRRFLHVDVFRGEQKQGQQSATEKPAQLSLGATAGGRDEKK
jgi:hypothetical protein